MFMTNLAETLSQEAPAFSWLWFMLSLFFAGMLLVVIFNAISYYRSEYSIVGNKGFVVYFMLAIIGIAGITASIVKMTQNAQEEDRIAHEVREKITEAIEEKYDVSSALVHFDPKSFSSYEEWIKLARKEESIISPYEHEYAPQHHQSIATVYMPDETSYRYVVTITEEDHIVLEKIDNSDAPSPTVLLREE